MSKLPVLTLLSTLALAALTSASGATFKLPADRPLVSLAVPDAWEPEPIDKGVQAQTSDGNVYLSAEVTRTVDDMNTIMDGTDALLKEHKVRLDKSSRKESKFDLGGLAADQLVYQARDEKGPTTVSITFVNLKDGVLVFTYWASDEGGKAHTKELAAVMQSVKTVK